MNFLYTKESPIKREVAAVLFLVWLVIVIAAAAGHAPWRDEVVAYALAIEGNSTFGMLANLHEGHPGLWYLLLRGVHSFFPTPDILPVITVIIAAAAMGLMLFYSPFSLPFMLAVLLTRFGFWEYPVMARSYGISMLILFLLAHYYPSRKERGVLLGSLLFLLVNCEALSLVQTFAFLLFWFLDILFTEKDPQNRLRLLKVFAMNAGIALLGTAIALWVVCADYARADLNGMGIFSAIKAIALKVFSPGGTLHEIAMPHWFGHFIDQNRRLLKGLPSLILVGSMLGLSRRPAALIAALAALVGFCAFSALVLGGGYRHHALLLVFFLALYWIVGKERENKTEEAGKDAKTRRLLCLRTAGSALFAFLILAQIPNGISFLYGDLSGEQPESRSGDVSALVHGNPEFKDAIIMSETDHFLQPLPYFLNNRMFLLRQGRYMVDGFPFPYAPGKPVISLGYLLDNARQLHAKEKAHVLILLNERLTSPDGAQKYSNGYTSPWGMSVTPEERQAFLKATTLVRSFGPALSDETYDVYEINDSTSVKR